MNYQSSLEFAKEQDQKDPLKKFKNEFYFPKLNGKEVLYFCGNSLGLQPKSVKPAVEQELNDWAELAVEGHVHAKNPWAMYQKLLTKSTAALVGAKPIEVTTMNSLTVNLNLLLVSFYKPTNKRFKIITEDISFSSDIYALENQCKYHGLNPKKAIIEVKPRKGKFTITTDDILKTIKEHGKETALVFFSGVNYYTGQAFDMEQITKAAHNVGAYAGFDLAHAAGNIELKLHKWNVDFASWCTYKYLNAGPGAVSQIFVHEEHAMNFKLPRFAGWWGHDEKERFLMKKGFKPMPGAEGWAQSNVNILSTASLHASLKLFDEAGIKNIVNKGQELTGYLEFLLKEKCKGSESSKGLFPFKIITPSSPKERGCQLSLHIKKDGKKLFEEVTKKGIAIDYRNPDVIRITPTPLYNSYEEVYQLCETLKELCYYEE